MFAKNPCRRDCNTIVTVNGSLAVAASASSRRATDYAPQELFYSRREHGLKMRALLFPGDDADLDVPEATFLEELV